MHWRSGLDPLFQYRTYVGGALLAYFGRKSGDEHWREIGIRGTEFFESLLLGEVREPGRMHRTHLSYRTDRVALMLCLDHSEQIGVPCVADKDRGRC